MAVPAVRVTFKQTELDLYRKIKGYSSPAAFLKDCAIEHFKNQESKKPEPQLVQPKPFFDELDIV